MTNFRDLRWQTSAALVVAGLILYVPANILPVMTMTVTGDVEPLTILGGVQELYDSGLWPVAGIVFIASIVVPFFKLACLSWLLLMHGSPALRRERTVMRRIVHTIGSWSMIDVFLLAILTAVGQLGILASVRAEAGGLFFVAVLLCTLFASEVYESRMIWHEQDPRAA
jgi:paraquat-inducible protein A